MIRFTVKKILNFFKRKKANIDAKFVSKLLGENKIRLIDIGAAGGIHEIWKPYKKSIDLIFF